VYSLGAILYELLAGRPPFLGETAHSVIEQVKTLDPIPIRRLQPGVPSDLETVCLKCLEKEPRRRYATARQLADDLGRFLRGESVQARPAGPAGRAWRWTQRHRALSFALSLIVLLLVGGVIGASLAAVRIKRAERSAVAGLRESLIEQSRGRRLAGGLGVRTETLESLRRAAAFGLDEDQRRRARGEAIAALALDEVRFVPQLQLPRAPLFRTAMDPTFRLLARVESNNTVVVQQIGDGREVGRWRSASASGALLGQPEFSGDGNHLGVLFRDRLDIWCVTNGQLGFSSRGPTNAYAFSSDGRRFALAHDDGSVTLRDLPSGLVVHRLATDWASPATPTSDSRRMSLSSDGSRLAVVRARTNCVEVFSFETGERLLRVAEGMGAKNTAWSRDDALLAVTCQNGPIQVWDTRTGELRHFFPQGNAAARCVAFHPRAPLLAAVSPLRSLTLRDRLTGRLLVEAPVDAADVAFSDDGSRLGPVWMGGQIGWLETSLTSCFRKVPVGNPQSPYGHVSFNPDGSALSVCSRQQLAVLDSRTLTPMTVITNRTVMFARFDPVGFLWTIDGSGVHRWRPTLNRSLELKLQKSETRWPGAEWRWLDFSADGQWMAAANRQMNRLVMSPLANPTNQIQVGRHRSPRIATLDRSARHVVSGSLSDKGLKLWDVERNQLLLDLPAGGHTGSAAFSPDGRRLATFGEEGLLWSVGQWTNAAATLFPSGETGLGDGVFSADSRWLAVVANLGEIHLFEVASARRVALFQAPESLSILALALSPDGRWLVALCQEGWLQSWDLVALRQELAPLKLDW
jgi:WD40 repeat protein